MSRKSLSIVANEAVRQTLGRLGSPMVQVAVRGRLTSSRIGNVLTIENVSTSRSSTLPIIASGVTKKALANAAEKTGSHGINLLGRVVSVNGQNTLLLDRVDKSLGIVADASTRELLSDLAAEGKGETEITAKIVDNVLVLSGNGKSKPKKK
jgi:hypothetical protein